MVEWQRLEVHFGCVRLGQELGPVDGPGGQLATPFAVVGDDDHLVHRRELGADLGQPFESGEPLAAVEVTIGGHHHLRFDLSEAVDHPICSEIG